MERERERERESEREKRREQSDTIKLLNNCGRPLDFARLIRPLSLPNCKLAVQRVASPVLFICLAILANDIQGSRSNDET